MSRKTSAVAIGTIGIDTGKNSFFGGLRTIGLNTGVITSRLSLKIPV